MHSWIFTDGAQNFEECLTPTLKELQLLHQELVEAHKTLKNEHVSWLQKMPSGGQFPALITKLPGRFLWWFQTYFTFALILREDDPVCIVHNSSTGCFNIVQPPTRDDDNHDYDHADADVVVAVVDDD